MTSILPNYELEIPEGDSSSVIITDKNGNILWVNPSFPNLTGYSMEEVVGKNPRLFKSGFHNKSFYKEMWDTIRLKKKWEGLLINKNKYGNFYRAMTTIIPIVGEKGEIDSYVGIQEDVSTFGKLCDKLSISEKKLSVVFDVVENALFVLSPEGNFLKANAAAEQILGYSSAELLTMNFYDITHPEDREKSRKKLEEVLNDKSIEKYSIEKRYIKKNGDVVIGLLSCSILRDTEGRCSFMISEIKDLTKEAQLISQIEKTANELEAANKIFKVVSEISQFTINQDIFNLDDVFSIAGQRLEMGCVFIQNCQENVEIHKFWEPNNSKISNEEFQKSLISFNSALLSRWVSVGHLFVGKPTQMPIALQYLSSIKSIEKSNQILILPVLLKQRPWGIIGFSNGNGHLWSEAEKEALMALSRLIVVMLENNLEKSKLVEHISFKFDELDNVLSNHVIEEIQEEVQG